jgi:hypothetical protein
MESGNSNQTMIIAAVVVVLLLCCCCAATAIVGWFFGDQIVEQLGLAFIRGLPLA